MKKRNVIILSMAAFIACLSSFYVGTKFHGNTIAFNMNGQKVIVDVVVPPEDSITAYGKINVSLSGNRILDLTIHHMGYVSVLSTNPSDDKSVIRFHRWKHGTDAARTYLSQVIRKDDDWYNITYYNNGESASISRILTEQEKQQGYLEYLEDEMKAESE